mmetsp:Transcript_2793/g.11398  ORF Transcript_2793/g.11398 Transcript_2793/m.11398 type:complete len:202 (+) Transcript_2793:198-803(+)
MSRLTRKSRALSTTPSASPRSRLFSAYALRHRSASLAIVNDVESTLPFALPSDHPLTTHPANADSTAATRVASNASVRLGQRYNRRRSAIDWRAADAIIRRTSGESSPLWTRLIARSSCTCAVSFNRPCSTELIRSRPTHASHSHSNPKASLRRLLRTSRESPPETGPYEMKSCPPLRTRSVLRILISRPGKLAKQFGSQE